MLKLFSFSDYTNKANLYAQLESLDERVLSVSGSLYDDTFWTKQQFEYALPKKDDFSFICLEEDSIIGFTIGYLFEPKWCHISRVAVHPDFQGKGIAKEMFSAQLKRMLQEAPDFITVDTKKTNSSAVKLYESFGFLPLENQELEAYVKIRNRSEQEYLGAGATHYALLKRFNQNLKLLTK